MAGKNKKTESDFIKELEALEQQKREATEQLKAYLKSQTDKLGQVYFELKKLENPDISKGHSNYFGLFMNIISIDPIEYGPLSITNGLSAVEEPFIAIQADNGEYVISSYLHDYRVSSDESVMIDGGRDYSRYTRVFFKNYINVFFI